MSPLLHSILFGVTVIGILIGLIGTIVPILPGPLLIFISVFGYAFLNQWQEPQLWITLLLLFMTAITGTSDIWLPYLGAAKSSGSKRASIYGIIGGIAGMFVGFVPGSIIGYALGVLLGTYQKHGDWQKAFRASLIGVAGRGTAILVQLGGGLIVLYFFIKTVLQF